MLRSLKLAPAGPGLSDNRCMKDKAQIVEDWLPRDTGVPLDQFGEYTLLTNFSAYLGHFARLTGAAVPGAARLSPMKRWVAAGVALWLTVAPTVSARHIPVAAGPQADPSALANAAFDVASVKRVAPTDADAALRVIPGVLMPGGRWVAANATLLQLLRSAAPEFSRPGRIVGGPGWIDTELFQIDARTSPDTPEVVARAMVQRLLRERFSLRTHVEAQPRDVYALVQASPGAALGPGLTRSPRQCEQVGRANNFAAGLDRCTEVWAEAPNGALRIQIPDLTLEALAVLIGDTVDRPIVDRTGLAGPFDVRLEYLTQLAPQGDTSGPSIFTAVREQLSLRLEARREPLDVLVIDGVSLPTPD
jgi:uncharacterized protein (TIGR03435 family)